MPRAVIQNGAIVPLEPLPLEWGDGTEVDVRLESCKPAEREAEADSWLRDMDAAVAEIDPRDAEIIDAAIREQDRIAKEQVRREMGLE